MHTLTQKPKESHNIASPRREAARVPYDLNLTSAHTRTPVRIQTKLAVSSPGDAHEQEADRVSEQVMRMSEPPRQLTCPCGGGCPACQAGQAGPSGPAGGKKERLQTKLVPTGGTAQIDTGIEAPPTVHEALRSSGKPLDPATRNFMEPRFGHDFSGVRVHSGTAAERSARDINAHAYTVGRDIVFGAGRFAPETREGRGLLAHELTHVVQQSDAGAAGARIQRFGSKEHRSLGDTATGGALVNVGGNSAASRFELTHGDVIALSGDYFSPDELMTLGALPGNRGANVGTRDEIILALEEIDSADPRFAAGGVWHGFVFSTGVRDAVATRYKNLAAQNTSHFYAPKGRNAAGQPIRSSSGVSAFDSYRGYHERALILAYNAGGTTGGSVSRAMAMEAAAQHFLTDSFSAGHLRTPIEKIRSYWGRRYPLFWYNLLHKMALDTAIRMNDIDTNLTTIGGTVQAMYEAIMTQVDTIASSLPPITLGDLLALIFHDFDNEMGLAVTGGRVYGDSNLDNPDPANMTRSIAQDAILAGNHDVNEAFMLGGSMPGLSNTQVFSDVRTGTHAPPDRYNAETLIPDLDPSNPPQNWHASNFETLWSQHMVGSRGPTVGDRIIAGMAPGNEIRGQLEEIAQKFPAVENRWSGNVHPRRSYLEGFVQPLARNPRAGVLSIIHWAPNYGLRDSDRDDISLATGNELATSGQLSGMTTPARAAYVRELIGGNVAGDEEALVVRIFSTAPAAQRPIIYRLVEGHNWTGNWIEGVWVDDDDIWNALNSTRLAVLRGLINAGVTARASP